MSPQAHLGSPQGETSIQESTFKGVYFNSLLPSFPFSRQFIFFQPRQNRDEEREKRSLDDGKRVIELSMHGDATINMRSAEQRNVVISANAVAA